VNLIRQLVRRTLPNWVLGIGGNITLVAAARAFGLCNNILLARMLRPTGYGIYSYAYAIVTTLSIPAQFGIPTVATREIAACASLGRWGLARGVIRWANWSIVVITTVIMALASLMLAVKAPRLSTPEFDAYVAALALIPLFAFDSLRGAILTGLQRTVLGRLPGDLLRPLLICFALLTASMFDPLIFTTPFGAIALTILAALTAYAIGGVILWRVEPTELTTTTPAYAIRHWNTSALPLGLISGIGFLNQNAGLLIAGSLLPSAAVGEYRVAVLGANFILMFQGAINNAFAPYYAKFYAQRDHASLQTFSARSARLSLSTAALPAAMYLIFGHTILILLFGPAYSPAYWPLVILTVGQLANAAAGSTGIILYMANQETNALLGSSVGTAVNVLACLALVPRLGITGAAIAGAASEIVWSLIWCWRAWKRLAIIPGPLPAILSRAIRRRSGV